MASDVITFLTNFIKWCNSLFEDPYERKHSVIDQIVYRLHKIRLFLGVLVINHKNLDADTFNEIKVMCEDIQRILVENEELFGAPNSLASYEYITKINVSLNKLKN